MLRYEASRIRESLDPSHFRMTGNEHRHSPYALFLIKHVFSPRDFHAYSAYFLSFFREILRGFYHKKWHRELRISEDAPLSHPPYHSNHRAHMDQMGRDEDISEKKLITSFGKYSHPCSPWNLSLSTCWPERSLSRSRRKTTRTPPSDRTYLALISAITP